jgi:hypothetical protein
MALLRSSSVWLRFTADVTRTFYNNQCLNNFNQKRTQSSSYLYVSAGLDKPARLLAHDEWKVKADERKNLLIISLILTQLFFVIYPESHNGNTISHTSHIKVSTPILVLRDKQSNVGRHGFFCEEMSG